MKATCERCGREFKSAQGLGGHYAARHEAQDQEQETKRRGAWLQAQKRTQALAEALARVQAQAGELLRARVNVQDLTARLAEAKTQAQRLGGELTEARALLREHTVRMAQSRAAPPPVPTTHQALSPEYIDLLVQKAKAASKAPF